MQLEDEFGDIVAKARIGNGLSDIGLAAKSGLSERDLQLIESYRLTPDRATIGRISALLSLDAPKLAAIAEGTWTPRIADPSDEVMLISGILVPFGSYSENAYVVACKRTRMAGVIDPGGRVDEINKRLADESLILSNVLITHAHGDHIGGIRELLAGQTGVVVTSSPIDREAVMRGIDARWQPADDGARLDVGELTATALATPGHTVGSTCYAFEGACFVGDTLFAGSIGRPSRAEVYAVMLDAIKCKILALPGATALLPGHGPATTVAQEIEHNPFF